MSKSKDKKHKVPKKIMGFKLSKGTRKDLKKLLKMARHPSKGGIAAAAATGLAAYLAERFASHQLDKRETRAVAAH